MSNQDKHSSLAKIIIGLLFVGAGIFPVLAAFDIPPFEVEKINGPPWLGLASGVIFVAAGLLVMLEDAAPLLKSTLGFLVFAGLSTIGNWIAFGAGERVCSGSISFLGFLSDGKFSDLQCRIPFGLGAVILDAFMVFVFVRFLQKAQGGPPKLARILKLAEWLLLLTLTPFLIPLVIWLAGHSYLKALRTRLTTGSWPRNESFIRRRTKKHNEPST